MSSSTLNHICFLAIRSFSRPGIALAVIFSLVWMGCGDEEGQGEYGTDSLITENDSIMISHNREGCEDLSHEQVLLIEGVQVEIRVPHGQVIGDLLLLPGWSFPKDDWCVKSSLCRKAMRKGYRLIMPNMGKSIYPSEYFPESRKDWMEYPTRTWLTDEMIPELQETYCLFEPGGKNFVIGLSTGGRGVALVALHSGSLFTAGAALSGDYDQSLLKGDNLMRGIYGSYDKFPERWEGEDNPALQAADFKTPLYLGHGKKDGIVPWSQTEHFYKLLRKNNPDLNVKLNLDANAGHDYAYWDSEVNNMLEFFESFHKPMAESSN